VTGPITAAGAAADDPQRLDRLFGIVGGGVVAVALAGAAEPGWALAGVGVALLASRYGGPFAFVFGVVALVAADATTDPWAAPVATAGLLGVLLGPALANHRSGTYLLTFAGAFFVLATAAGLWAVRPRLSPMVVLALLGAVGGGLAVAVRLYAARVVPGQRPPDRAAGGARSPMGSEDP
jgi:hypothetical protein